MPLRTPAVPGAPAGPAHRVLAVAALAIAAFNTPAAGAPANELPPEVKAALQRARVPEEALSVTVQELGSARSVLALNPREPVNPASLVKLVTTYAALDQLGPAWTWSTPVWLLGNVRDGVLEGDLVIKGQGDPKLVIERLWLLLRRVQQLGVRDIRGDIVLDHSAFAPAEGAAADFDGDPTRPYNVQPDALLLNYKTVIYSFVPEPGRGVARVIADPALPGSVPERTVPLTSGACTDWRSALKATPGDAGYRFAGAFQVACGEMSWPLADPDAASYNARLVALLWRELGGRLRGSVRDGPSPADMAPAFEYRSLSLSETVRDINKFSNNVMAQQLFLTLALVRQPATPATAEGARDALRRWVAERLGDVPAELVLDNGSGLSRQTRVSAQWLARLLQHAGASAVMPELMSSLPVNGLDGTMRRSRASAGRAHLKTGSLRDVAGVAGYVLADSGRRYVLVAIINHPNANQARPAIDALVQWTVRDAPAQIVR
jgi:D-alanyl-D-alanine carboxypeptidase/D-alanyl-D-alanine-endopeptidase (penicillin-binding protein 4)